MGCAGSEEKKEGEPVVVEEGAAPAGKGPLIMTVTNKWNEGKTKEDVVAALSALQAKAMTVEGVRAFQYSVNEETKTNMVTEVYDDAGVIQKFFAAVGEVELPALIAAITTTETLAAGPKAQVDAAAEALKGAGFTATLFYTDECGECVKMPEKTGKPFPLIMTVQNTWNEGQTKADVVKALKNMGKKAMTVEGVYAFQYGINEEKKLNQVTEIYESAEVIGKFFAAVGETTLPPLVKAITTTKTLASGSKADTDAAAGGLAQFSPTLFVMDDVGAACQGFGGAAEAAPAEAEAAPEEPAAE